MRTPGGEGKHEWSPTPCSAGRQPPTRPLVVARSPTATPPTRLDDVVPQTNDQSVGAIGLELVPKLIEDLVELGQVPGPDGCRGRWKRKWVREGGREGWGVVGRQGAICHPPRSRGKEKPALRKLLTAAADGHQSDWGEEPQQHPSSPPRLSLKQDRGRGPAAAPYPESAGSTA